MTRFLVRRFAHLVGGLFVVSVVIFCALRVLPGDIAQLIAGTAASPEQVASIREELGLNRPLLQQYSEWLLGLLRGDLGQSLSTHTDVADEIAEKLSVTLPLAALALLLGVLFALAPGVLAGLWQQRFAGRMLGAAALVLAAVPVVWVGVLLIGLFSGRLGWLPAQGFPIDGWQDPAQAWRSLLLPALTIACVEGAILFRFVRAATIRALGSEVVRAAAARGMTLRQALIRAGLPEVGLSVISVLGLQVAALIGGAVVVEQLFALPGLGQMMVRDVNNRNLVQVQSELMVLSALVLCVGVAVDVLHRVIDPRQLYPAEGEAA